MEFKKKKSERLCQRKIGIHQSRVNPIFCVETKKKRSGGKGRGEGEGKEEKPPTIVSVSFKLFRIVCCESVGVRPSFQKTTHWQKQTNKQTHTNTQDRCCREK